MLRSTFLCPNTNKENTFFFFKTQNTGNIVFLYPGISLLLLVRYDIETIITSIYK